MKSILILTLVCFALCDMATPAHEQGYVTKAIHDPKVRIDLFEDPLCSACKTFDKGFHEFMKRTHDGKPIYETVEIHIHPFPLPYHHNAFFSSKLFPFMWDQAEEGNEGLFVYEYLHWCMETQDEFLTSKSAGLTEAEVQDKMCTMLVADFDTLNLADCQAAFKNSKYEMAARTDWKYSSNMRITGTPSMLINDVVADAPFDAADWDKFIQTYVE